MIEINLLPGAGRKSRSRGARKIQLPAALSGLSAGGAGLKDPWLIAAVAAALIGALGIGTLFFTQSTREGELAESLERATADSARYASVLRDRVRAESTRDTILRQLNIVRAVDGERFIWPHLLEEVSRALPQYTWLTTLGYAGTPQGSAARQIVTGVAPTVPGAAPTTAAADTAAKAPVRVSTEIPLDTVSLRIIGQTIDIQALTRFMRDLEQSPFLEQVQLEKSELVLVEGKEATQFSLLARYARPDSTAVRRVPLAAIAR